MRGGWLPAALALFVARPGDVAAAADRPAPAKTQLEIDQQVAAALVAALPTDGLTDVVLIDHPATSGAPRVRMATAVSAPPATVRAVLLDPAHYQAVIPSLVGADLSAGPEGSTAIDWEIEIPLFNLDGRIVLRPRPDGAELQLAEGDLSPGRIVFTVAPRPGGSTLMLDAQLDVRNSTFLLRRIIARSPVGEPAGLATAAYIAMRAVALRAQTSGAPKAWRPGTPMAPPPTWLPDPAPLTDPRLAPLRARGALALVARVPTQRLGGVTVAVPIAQPAAVVTAHLRNPLSWRAFPGWHSVIPRPGAHGSDATVADNLPLADFDATWTAEAAPPLRWVVTDGDTRGARLGWTVTPQPDGSAVTTLTLYPRLETTGRVARRAITAEPLMEHGLALGLALADAAAVKAMLDSGKPR
jgi:hypothetical protein